MNIEFYNDNGEITAASALLMAEMLMQYCYFKKCHECAFGDTQSKCTIAKKPKNYPKYLFAQENILECEEYGGEQKESEKE